MTTVSIVIPCRNEEKYIGRCLDSIIKNQYPDELVEIFVCDGLSTDNSPNIIKGYTEEHANIRLLANDKLTAPYALNLGIRKSKSDVIIILSAHCEISPDFISNCITELNKDEKIACVGGFVNNIFENKMARLIGHAMSSSFGVGNVYFRTGTKEGFVDTVAFGAYKKSIFEKLGYFDEELSRNQDDEFNFRLIKNGYKIALKKNIRSNYYVRASFKKLYKQYFQYGYWKVFVNKKHRTITSFRQIVPLFFVLYLFAGVIASFINQLFLYIFLIILGVYVCLGIYFSFLKSRKINETIKITWAFFILHFSYGFGYLSGILRFLIMQKQPESKHEKISR